MTCTGVCSLCGMYRDSKLCTCLDRRRNNDPLHPAFAEVAEFIRETRFFGNEAKDTALEMILAARQPFYRGVADGTIADGDILKRIDRDAERMKQRAMGKLFATAQKMAERKPSQPRTRDLEAARFEGLTNAERLREKMATNAIISRA